MRILGEIKRCFTACEGRACAEHEQPGKLTMVIERQSTIDAIDLKRTDCVVNRASMEADKHAQIIALSEFPHNTHC